MSYERFVKPREGAQFPSEYDLSTWMLNEPQWRDIAPVQTVELNLNVAGSLVLNSPGYGFVQWGYDGLITGSNLAETFVEVGINSNNQEMRFPSKSGRGYVGSFVQLFLTWPAQPSVGVDVKTQFIIFKSQRTPWMTGNGQ